MFRVNGSVLLFFYRDAQGRDESYANGEIFEAGEGLGMAAGADEAGSATIDLIDVAVAAASAGTVSALKARLLRAVAGVDRGVAATSSDIQTIEEAAQVTPLAVAPKRLRELLVSVWPAGVVTAGLSFGPRVARHSSPPPVTNPSLSRG